MGNMDLIHIIQKSASDGYRIQHPWELLSEALPQIRRDSGVRSINPTYRGVHQPHIQWPEPRVLSSAAAAWSQPGFALVSSKLTIGVCSLGRVSESEDKRALFLVGPGGQGPPRRSVGFPF